MRHPIFRMTAAMARVQALRTILFFGALIGAVLLAVQAISLRGLASGQAGWAAGAAGLAFLVAGIVVGARLRERRARPTAAGPLSARELDVLRGIARGQSNREIAENHFRSVNTIKTQVAQIYSKLGVGGRVQAVERARELGLLE